MNSVFSIGWGLYAMALAVGVAFGIILERVGFTSCRRLVGVFYGYDMAVLKMFFSAIITAAAGLWLLDLCGFKHAALSIPITYVGAALVGGLVMGLGFIIGGYCPGTGLCAVTTGKIDAMVFIGGVGIGTFLFGYHYPTFQQFHMEWNLGPITLNELFKLPKGIIVLFMIIGAGVMFFVAEYVEKRMRK